VGRAVDAGIDVAVATRESGSAALVTVETSGDAAKVGVA
jgi:hypothetical protein